MRQGEKRRGWASAHLKGGDKRREVAASGGSGGGEGGEGQKGGEGGEDREGGEEGEGGGDGGDGADGKGEGGGGDNGEAQGENDGGGTGGRGGTGSGDGTGGGVSKDSEGGGGGNSADQGKPNTQVAAKEEANQTPKEPDPPLSVNELARLSIEEARRSEAAWAATEEDDIILVGRCRLTLSTHVESALI